MKLSSAWNKLYSFRVLFGYYDLYVPRLPTGYSIVFRVFFFVILSIFVYLDLFLSIIVLGRESCFLDVIYETHLKFQLPLNIYIAFFSLFRVSGLGPSIKSSRNIKKL
jgi:hypothetical protein